MKTIAICCALLLSPCAVVAASDAMASTIPIVEVPGKTQEARPDKPNQGPERREARRKAFNERVRAAFAKRDANGDGKLSTDEVKVKDKAFGTLDRDGDGSLSLGEFRSSRVLHMARKRFAKLDSDKDGHLTRTESKMSEKAFAKADLDKDGKLSKSELRKRIAQGLRAPRKDGDKPKKAAKPRG